MSHWLPYVTGGLAWSQSRFSAAPSATAAASETQLRYPLGWTLGAGAELAFAPSWTVRAEYLFDRLGEAKGAFGSGAQVALLGTSLHSVRLGLNWHFDVVGERSPPSWSDSARDETIPRPPWPIRREDWSVHGQSTFVEQGYFNFNSPYQGTNSLSGNTQFANTFSATLFLGLRLWAGGGFYYNPEIDQGFGLSQTLGLAAFPNGEAQKASYAVPRLNIDRVMLRQTFGLGGEKETLDDGPNQLPGERDLSRITVSVGRLAVVDAFGLNTYASDPRTQFSNWNIYGCGSFDQTMDRPGFTWGGVVELNQRQWALRLGYYLEPTESNGNTYDLNIPTRGQYLAEPEVRTHFSRTPASFGSWPGERAPTWAVTPTPLPCLSRRPAIPTSPRPGVCVSRTG